MLAALVSACTPDSADPIAAPDAAPAPTALEPAGTFTLASTYALAAPPPELAPLLGELATATDDADDPTAYLVDLVVDALPEGNARTVAVVLAPYVAANLHDRVAAYAPELVPALRAMATGAARIATRFTTLEDLVVIGDASADRTGHTAIGHARRSVRGVRVDATDIPFSSIGLADTTTDAEITVELVGTATRAEEPRQYWHRLAITRHTLSLPVAAWFRPAFDRAVIPSVVPEATDLASALRTLVDCPRLGALISDAVGLGSPALYAQACAIGLVTGARAIYERFPATTTPAASLALVGVARAIDRDNDGVMDAVSDGVWTGTLGSISVGTSSFEGTAR